MYSAIEYSVNMAAIKMLCFISYLGPDGGQERLEAGDASSAPSALQQGGRGPDAGATQAADDDCDAGASPRDRGTQGHVARADQVGQRGTLADQRRTTRAHLNDRQTAQEVRLIRSLTKTTQSVNGHSNPCN